MCEKESEVGSLIRNHSGRRGRGLSSAELSAGISFFHFLPEARELLWPEVGEDFSIHIDDRRQLLAGEPYHFVKSRLVGDNIDLFIINTPLVQPAHCLMTPATIRLYEESNPFLFHSIKWRTKHIFSNVHRKKVLNLQFALRTVPG